MQARPFWHGLFRVSETFYSSPVVDSCGARAGAWLATWRAVIPPSELPFMFTWPSGLRATLGMSSRSCIVGDRGGGVVRA